METILLIAVLLMLVIIIFLIMRKPVNEQGKNFDQQLHQLESGVNRIESAVRAEFSTNRTENNEALRNNRQELSNTLRGFEESIGRLTSIVDSKLLELNNTQVNNARDTRKDTAESLLSFRQELSRTIAELNSLQKENFLSLLSRQDQQNRDTNERLERMRETLEKKVAELQTNNEKKLEDIRITVDEKLQKTLETRLGESFRIVSERLEAVHKGLGDMQQLATGVGDLKRVLTNVKARGVLGEYQLENLLDQMLTPDQYAKNVKTKEGSNALVEFAIRFPGQSDDRNKPMWMPVDSKFPKEDFELLLDAYDHGNPEFIENHRRDFVRGIRKCAADIAQKYIDPPNTTDFAIMFLPFESLYAEVLRTPGLFESVQRECKIIITGPTTLSAILNSLQMGFRTLVIEKRSSEVWHLLGAVKTEFGTFAGILEKTQKKLQEATNVIDQAGVRSRSIERKLRAVQELPSHDNPALLTDE